MAESPSTMRSVEYIQDLLDLLVEKEIQQTDTLTAIQNDILTAIKGVETAIKDVETAIKDVENTINSLHSAHLSVHEESVDNVPVDNDVPPSLRLTPLLNIPTQGR